MNRRLTLLLGAFLALPLASCGPSPEPPGDGDRTSERCALAATKAASLGGFSLPDGFGGSDSELTSTRGRVRCAIVNGAHGVQVTYDKVCDAIVLGCVKVVSAVDTTTGKILYLDPSAK